jgi:S-DNA-T family DNA segregation ATPase FtsK/SpoIIIE
VVLPLAGHHLLLGGEPGAGKSNALSLVVGAAALDPNVELWLFDGKLVELASWRRCARRFVGPNLEDATSVLRELQQEMEDRYAWMLDRGLRGIDRHSGPGLVLLVIDELALYLQGRSKAREELADVLRDIVARGRAAGIVVAAATQKPASDIVPTSIRDLLGCRLALRCSTKDASDTVLGVAGPPRAIRPPTSTPPREGWGTCWRRERFRGACAALCSPTRTWRPWCNGPSGCGG